MDDFTKKGYKWNSELGVTSVLDKSTVIYTEEDFLLSNYHKLHSAKM